MSVLPEIMVVRDGNGGHAQLIGPVEKLLYGRKSVQDGVLGVDMEVNETHGVKVQKNRGPSKVAVSFLCNNFTSALSSWRKQSWRHT